MDTGDVRSRSQVLAAILLQDVEAIAERSVARMQELLPSYARVPRDELFPVTLANTRGVLEAIRDPDRDPIREQQNYRASGDRRARQGITSDEMLHAWRIGLEGVREAAYAVVGRHGIGKDALLEFVEETLRWGDAGMRASAAAHHETELRELGRLAAEQEALRRVATMVARESSPEEVFASVAEEVGLLVQADAAGVWRYEQEGDATIVATWGESGGAFLTPRRWSLEGDSAAARVFRTGRAARLEADEDARGPVAAAGRSVGLRSSAGCPIVVDRRLWGAIGVASRTQLPADAEARIAQFTELLATAISNVHQRSEVRWLAEEQAALRRVATMVAREHPAEEVLARVAEEVARLLGVDSAAVWRFEPNGDATVVAQRGSMGRVLPVGHRVALDGESVAALVYRTERPARFSDFETATSSIAVGAREVGLRLAVGSPIFVGGRLWGALVAGTSRAEPMPTDAESRIAEFTELVATAISNVQARGEVEKLAEEQAALRRVATLVARESSPEDVFAKVAEEVGHLLDAETALIHHYEPDGPATVVGTWDRIGAAGPVTSWKLDSDTVTGLWLAGCRRLWVVYQTARPTRFDSYEHAAMSITAEESGRGVRSAVASPIIVNRRLWGAIVVATSRPEPLPTQAESRIAQFTQLVATAISNLQVRSDLAASRARIVAAADEERRRVVRDLHDGAQQRLVHTIVTLKLARRALARGREDAPALLSEAQQHAQTATDELRELAHGILPSALTNGGLAAAVKPLASRMTLHVDIDVPDDRFSPAVEATSYFIVAEALTNVAKHSRAQRATVTGRVESGLLNIEVRDNGVGGARAQGSGLLGLRDRLSALGGTLRVESPANAGTLIAASIPVGETADGGSAG